MIDLRYLRELLLLSDEEKHVHLVTRAELEILVDAYEALQELVAVDELQAGKGCEGDRCDAALDAARAAIAKTLA